MGKLIALAILALLCAAAMYLSYSWLAGALVVMIFLLLGSED